MSLLDDIAATNDAQIRAIDARIADIRASVKIELAELKHARSILVGRRRRLGKDRDNGQAELPFEPASATVVTEHLARVEREAEGEAESNEDPDLAAAMDVGEPDRMHAAHPVFTPPDPGVEPRLRRRRGVERG